jgi:ABC-type Mn2+/Zn2+ transport system ATPase subunit
LTPSNPDPDSPLLSLRGAVLGYGGRPVLAPVDLEVHAGEFLGLVGPNGSGKTTVLRAMMGLLAPLSGSVTRSNVAVRFGYVPQRKALDRGWPLRAEDIVLMGLMDRVGLLRRPGEGHRAAARRALAAVGVEELAKRPFDALSGGQKQRTLIARALAGRPSVLLLDEPTAGMDLPGTRSVLSLLRRLHRDGLTIVLVTHRLNEVANTARRVALFTEEGLEVGPVQEVLTPTSLTRLYGVPVRTALVEGSLIILEGDADGEGNGDGGQAGHA